MISNQVFSSPTVSLEELFPKSTQALLEPFKEVIDGEFKEHLHLKFEIAEKKRNKVSPILRLARQDDAKEIVEIYKELYNGTYPYKEMEDEEEVRNMIEDPNVEWVIYQDPSYTIAGCITFVLDFSNKRGYIRGFMLKKKYQGYIDITKAMIGSMLAMLNKYKDVIYTWYVENRTAHAKSQYSMWVCGIAPIGIYPNKDVFLGKVESDLMQILYDERALRKYRCTTTPQLISPIDACFQYSSKRYNLGSYARSDPQIKLSKAKIKKLSKRLKKKLINEKYGYETIILTLEGTDSYFKFLYTPQVRNFEKTEYMVTSLEELYVFTRALLHYKQILNVRYCELFVSAYNPKHQQLFFNAGFRPRGYVPSWEYCNENNCFKDVILFNIFDGEIDKDIQLIEQGKELVQIIGLAQFSKVGEYLHVKNRGPEIQESPLELISPVSALRSQKTVKHAILGAMWIYLSLVFLSLIVASEFGYNILANTISDLGSSNITPFPFLFDMACIIAGIITIPYNLFLHHRSKKNSTKKVIHITSYCGVLWGIIGGLGYLFLGVFSSDRGGPNGILHGLCAFLSFLGFVLSILFFSVQFVVSKQLISKIFGIFGVVIPILMLLVNLIQLTPVSEWMLFLSIWFHIVPLNHWSVT
ncbi:MAG: DUF998 domain-containing protein [Promethearchaeota archaeon]